jgi:hypothetical protein
VLQEGFPPQATGEPEGVSRPRRLALAQPLRRRYPKGQESTVKYFLLCTNGIGWTKDKQREFSGFIATYCSVINFGAIAPSRPQLIAG